MPIDAVLLRNWAEQISKGKATLTDPGAGFIMPYVKRQILVQQGRAQRKRGTKRQAESPPKGRNMTGGHTFNINTASPGAGHQSMLPPAWALPFLASFGPFNPSFSGQPWVTSGEVAQPDRHSSPPTIDGADDDQLLRDYFNWLKQARPSKQAQLDVIFEELEEQGYGFSQLNKVLKATWTEMTAPQDIKDSVLGQTKAFQRHQKRVAEARKARKSEIYDVSSGGASE